jgi:hypothetical protein
MATASSLVAPVAAEAKPPKTAKSGDEQRRGDTREARWCRKAHAVPPDIPDTLNLSALSPPP